MIGGAELVLLHIPTKTSPYEIAGTRVSPVVNAT